MDNAQDIIDIKRHPIDNLNEYAMRCRSDLQENSILILNKFLTKEALLSLQQEAKTLQNKAKFQNANEIIKIDGLRVEYDYGFGLMRASNTTPVIVLRFEANSNENLKLIQNEFKEILETYIPQEKIPF